MFETIEACFQHLLERKNTEYGIEHLNRCFAALGNPQYDLKTIHVAGTNGKGSTTNFICSILQTEGYRVGSFTSPHLVVHNDRIRINGLSIPDADLLRYANQTYSLWDSYKLSMFEIDMLISVLYFIDQNVDYAVYEVGLGGRLDATNVILPCISLITNVDYDHMNILGNTLEAIANEKAGIIKAHVPVLTTDENEVVLTVIEKRSREMAAPFTHIMIPEYTVAADQYHFIHEGVEISLRHQGVYQVRNAALAISAIKRLDLGIADDIIKKGIENARWAGRFEEIVPQVILDGAHNRIGIEMLVESLQILPKPWIIVFTALKDKEYHDMIALLEKASDVLIITEFTFMRAAKAIELASGHQARIIEDYKEALKTGYQLKKSGTLIVTGSLYFISEARQYFMDIQV